MRIPFTNGDLCRLHLIVALATVLIVSSAVPVFAWSEAGHKIVGAIAFRLLNHDQQAQIVAILRHYPRWQKDFQSKMPFELSNPDDR